MSENQSIKGNIASLTSLEVSSDDLSNDVAQLQKRKYQKPIIKSEALNSYGAICNGTTTGGRKASALAPTFCNANRLNT